MVTSQRRPWSARRCWAPYRVIIPGAAGVSMLIASVLPWFTNPSGTRLIAWQLPVDLGWQLRSGMFNYGLICACCALYIFYVTRQTWLVLRAQNSADPTYLLAAPRVSLTQNYIQAGLLCLVPMVLFLFQFLCADMVTVADVTRQQIQLELARTHLGYQATPEFTPILPFTLHESHIAGRLAMLTNQLSPGWFVPLISMAILFTAKVFLPMRIRLLPLAFPTLRSERRRRNWLLGVAVLLGLIIFGRAPAALACQAQADHFLNVGEYTNALNWLDHARTLNPSFEQSLEYHIARGKAWYFLHPQQPNAESAVYLGDYYRSQNDVYSAYQALQNSWNTYAHTPWLRDEVSLSLIQMAELSRPLRSIPKNSLVSNEPALPWLTELLKIDDTNFYAHFTIGRILYDLHDYSGCEAHMRMVLNIISSPEMQSAAYTYIAMSRFDSGDISNAREYLYKAQNLDPAYRNNTARQHMSGMR
ncbi:hypothetical protein KDA_02190 [Dictyobacter alpinus]|uniref:Uncharacterized protein n=1 Tax=Dictyobacter alpinus TaxID=2014873 RepID=A0A402B055_9CHLR|nr:hypothetical protein [Dictyobacter alpinus]GCE24735.1 hypothetical protein KDA_02190 [Dictyobacter alpinus]